MASKQHEIKVYFDAVITPFRQKMNELSGEVKKLNSDFRLGTETMKHTATQGEKLAYNSDYYRQKLALETQGLQNHREQLNKLNEDYRNGQTVKEEWITREQKAVEQSILTQAKLRNQLYESELAANTYNNTFSQVGRVFEQTGSKMQTLGNGVRGIGNALMPVSLGLVAVGKSAYDEFNKLESGIAGVRKTTNLTKQELAGFTAEVREFSKNNPFDVGLVTKVSELGGQMNIAKESLLDFSKVMLEMDITTDLDLEQGTMQMAQFAAVTKMSHGDFRKLGSTIVELGNNFAAREPEILMLGHRLAGVGNIVGLTQAEILGFSAAIAQTGINVQAGGSNFSKTMLDIQLAVSGAGQSAEEYMAKLETMGLTMDDVTELVKRGGDELAAVEEQLGFYPDTLETFNKFFKEGANDLQLYAQVAGVTAEEFAKMFQETPADALTAFVEGLSKMKERGEDVAAMLDNIGIKNKLQRDVLLRLAGATGEVTRAQNMANEAWEKGTALGDEAAIRYETTASKMEVAKNRIKDLMIDVGEGLAPVILDLVEDAGKLIGKWNELDQDTQKLIIKAGLLTAAAGPVLSVLGNLISITGTLTSTTGTLIGSKGIGGLVGKLMTAKPVFSETGELIGNMATQSTIAGNALGTAGTSAGGLATGAKGVVAALGGTGGLIALLGVTAFGIIAVKDAMDEAAKSKAELLKEDWNKDESNMSEVWKNKNVGTGWKWDQGADYTKQATFISDETKEIMRAYDERNEIIYSSTTKALGSLRRLEGEEREAAISAAKEQSELLIGISKENADEKRQLIEDMIKFSDGLSEEEKIKNLEILQQRNQDETDELEKLGEKRRTALQAALEAEGEDRRRKYEEFLEIDREFQERSMELIGETSEQKLELAAKLNALNYERSKESAQEIIDLANESRTKEIEIVRNAYDQMLIEAERAYQAGDITKEAYEGMLTGAKRFKDEGINELNKDMNSLIQTLGEQFPNATITIDQETGKMKIAFDETKQKANDLFGVFATESEKAVTALSTLSTNGQASLKELKANGFDIAIKAMEDGTNQIQLTKDGVVQATSTISAEGVSNFNAFANGTKSNLEGTAISSINNLIAKLWEANNTPLYDKSNMIKTTYQSVHETIYKGGSRAMSWLAGINYVPFDNARAILHEGERVLTKDENRAYNKANNKSIAETLKKLESNLTGEKAINRLPNKIENHYSIELKNVHIHDDRDPERLVREIQREIERIEELG